MQRDPAEACENGADVAASGSKHDSEQIGTPPQGASTGVRLPRYLAVLDTIREAIASSNGWRRRGFALLFGGLSVLAMAPFEFWPILFLTLPPLVWLIDGTQAHERPLRAATLDGWWFGFGYFFFGLFWVGEAFLVEAHIFGWLLPFAITLMPAGLAVFTAAAFALARTFWHPSLARVVILAVCLTLVEYLRGHIFTGFPWNILGYAFTSNLALMQSAALIGVYGLTAVTVLICTLPLVAATDAITSSGARPMRPAILAVLALSLGPLAGLYAYGVWVLPTNELATLEGVKIRIVQPSVPQHHKWARDKQAEIFADHLDLSKRDEQGRIDNLEGVTHVVWPEASMPFLPLATPQALAAIADLLPDDKYLLAGALRLEGSKPGDEVRPSVRARSRVYNSIIVFGPDGNPLTLYDKLHLVPFGEYLPFRETMDQFGLEALTRIRGGFASGPAPRPNLSVPGLPPVGPLICYEAIFPAAVIQTAERPGVLVNSTNDGWFGNMTGPYQHFQQSRLRAVEEGLPLVRAANNGVSALIDPYGRVVKSIALNERGVIDVKLPEPKSPTVYGMYGDRCLMLILLLFLLVAFGLMSYPSHLAYKGIRVSYATDKQ